MYSFPGVGGMNVAPPSFTPIPSATVTNKGNIGGRAIVGSGSAQQQQIPSNSNPNVDVMRLMEQQQQLQQMHRISQVM